MSSPAPREPRGTITSTAWVPAGNLRLAEWLDYGRRLGALGRGVAWWIGDWLRYGNERYGEKYVRAARVTGYDVQSLMNMVYVASRFEEPRRRPTLSWSHHAEVAALERDAQDRWLDFAEAQHLSVHSLRLEIRTWRRQQGLALPEAEALPATDERPAGRVPSVVCPRCMHVIEIAAEADR